MEKFIPKAISAIYLRSQSTENYRRVQYLFTLKKTVTNTAHYISNGNFNFMHNAAHGHIIIKCQKSV